MNHKVAEKRIQSGESNLTLPRQTIANIPDVIVQRRHSVLSTRLIVPVVKRNFVSISRHDTFVTDPRRYISPWSVAISTVEKERYRARINNSFSVRSERDDNLLRCSRSRFEIKFSGVTDQLDVAGAALAAIRICRKQ